jgi:hypothetical protein
VPWHAVPPAGCGDWDSFSLYCTHHIKKNVVANGNTTLPLDDAIDKDNYHHIFYNHGFLSPSHFPCGQLEPYVLLKYKHYTSLAVSIIFVSFFFNLCYAEI